MPKDPGLSHLSGNDYCPVVGHAEPVTSRYQLMLGGAGTPVSSGLRVDLAQLVESKI